MIDITYFSNRRDALAEVRKRNSAPDRKGMIARVDQSPYGGYRVYSIQADQLVEQMADGSIFSSSLWSVSSHSRRVAG